MQQLTCTGPGKVEWRDVAAPRIQDDAEALVRPLAVARCDIDLFLTGGVFPVTGPFALGHECVGEVAAVGDAVRRVRIGERVVVAFQVTCGSCPSCRAGHTANCTRFGVLSDYGMQPLSGMEFGGMLSDLIRVPFADAMLQPIGRGLDPVSLASVSDNVLDGYRAVARHLAARPGAEVLVVSHGLPSIPLYAVQAAMALGATRVDFASDDGAALERAQALGATPVHTDFQRPPRRYPIVAEGGLTPAGLHYAIRATEPEGTCQSVSFFAGGPIPLPLGKMYTLGIRYFIGRCHAAALLPEVVPLIEAGRLRPQEVTTRVVDWAEAPEAWLEPTTKLIVRR